jgi:hypothetical protein
MKFARSLLLQKLVVAEVCAKTVHCKRSLL